MLSLSFYKNTNFYVHGSKAHIYQHLHNQREKKKKSYKIQNNTLKSIKFCLIKKKKKDGGEQWEQ